METEKQNKKREKRRGREIVADCDRKTRKETM